MKIKIIVVGGGWGGCAAALSARKAGAEVVLLERTDMLLGSGLVGGIFFNNGRLTAALEMESLGAGELFQIMLRHARHRNLDFNGHCHASLYDINSIEPAVRRHLEEAGIEVFLLTRVVKLDKEANRLKSAGTESGLVFTGDAFIDATGTAGPAANCRRFGNGCAMCIYRCPSFGGRVSLVSLAGIKEYPGRRPDGGVGSLSGSCKIYKESLAPELVQELEDKGILVLPLSPGFPAKEELLERKACQQYALPDFAKNLILLDTGQAKLMAPFFPLASLRQLRGLGRARYADPYAGSIGNSVRFLALAPRDASMKVEGLANLFCAGEKAGLFVGHTEAILTGTLAGHNAVRLLAGREPLILPATLAVGDMLAYADARLKEGPGVFERFTFSGSLYFERMQAAGLYTKDREVINNRVEAAGLTNVFQKDRS